MANDGRSGNLLTDGLEALDSLFRRLKLWKASEALINLFSSGSVTGPFSVSAGLDSLVVVFFPDCSTVGVGAGRVAGNSRSSSSSSIEPANPGRKVSAEGFPHSYLAAVPSLGTPAYSEGPSKTRQNHLRRTHLGNLVPWIWISVEMRSLRNIT